MLSSNLAGRLEGSVLALALRGEDASDDLMLDVVDVLG